MEPSLKTEVYLTLIYFGFMLVTLFEVTLLKLSLTQGSVSSNKFKNIWTLFKKSTVRPLVRKNFKGLFLTLILPLLSILLVYFVSLDIKTLTIISLFISFEHLRRSKYENLAIVGNSIILGLFTYTNNTIPWAILSVHFLLFINLIDSLKVTSVLFYAYSLLYFLVLWLFRSSEFTILLSLIAFPLIVIFTKSVKDHLPKMKMNISQGYTWVLILLSFCVEGVLI